LSDNLPQSYRQAMEHAADPAPLPFVDEHHVRVDAPPGAVWLALGASLRHQGRGGAAYGRVVGTVPARAQGDPLEEGSAIPGFGTREAVPGERLVLAGRHRFSRYELVFGLQEDHGATVLTARTLAEFPGPHGRVYRALVIDSGAHRRIVRRWLGSIERAAERGQVR
jgi:hypothetical protein